MNPAPIMKPIPPINDKIMIIVKPNWFHASSDWKGVKPVTVTAEVATKKLSTNDMLWFSLLDIGKNSNKVPNNINKIKP